MVTGRRGEGGLFGTTWKSELKRELGGSANLYVGLLGGKLGTCGSKFQAIVEMCCEILGGEHRKKGRMWLMTIEKGDGTRDEAP